MTSLHLRALSFEDEVKSSSIIRHPPEEDEIDFKQIRRSWVSKFFWPPCLFRNYGIKLDPFERIIYVGNPLYLKNVVILAVFWIILFTIVFLIPFIIFDSWFGFSGFLRFLFTFFFILIYSFFVVYIVLYKLIYKKLTIQYILTTKRAIVLKGSGQLGQLKEIVNQYGPVGGISDIIEFQTPHESYTSYYYKEINEVYFMYHDDRGKLGSVFFGYEIVNYSRLFSVMSMVKNSGFEMIPDMYYVIDLILYHCQKEGSTAICARLINGLNDPALTSKVIQRVNSCCGFIYLPGICSIKPPREGKISEDDYKKLTCMSVEFMN